MTRDNVLEPGVGDIAHNLVQCTIARHGLRAAVEILHDASHRVDDVLHVQQQRHPEDWPELKQQPAAQTARAETDNGVKIPQVPRVN